MKKLTEQPSLYDHLERMSTTHILASINREDHKIATAVKTILPLLEKFVDVLASKMKNGGRLFYIGAGTSGRLGILDASECPPTFGVPHGMVVGVIAGGDSAIRKAVEFAEDDEAGAWKDLQEHEPGPHDSVVGIAASGTTPYVVGGLRDARETGMLTASLTCNPGSPVTKVCAYPLELDVGPEFVTGSTRMKSGTAQKMVLNMLSTAVMIKLGRVQGNRMVDMQLSNQKLVDRGTRMVMEVLGINYEAANMLLKEQGSVRDAIGKYKKDG